MTIEILITAGVGVRGGRHAHLPSATEREQLLLP